MWTRVGPSNHVLDGVQFPVGMDNFERRGASHCKVKVPSAVNCVQTAERIEMPFGLWTRMGPWKRVLVCGAHWRHLVNTIEPPMCDGDAAFCQITLTTCLISCSYRFDRVVFGSDHSL